MLSDTLGQSSKHKATALKTSMGMPYSPSHPRSCLSRRWLSSMLSTSMISALFLGTFISTAIGDSKMSVVHRRANAHILSTRLHFPIVGRRQRFELITAKSTPEALPGFPRMSFPACRVTVVTEIGGKMTRRQISVFDIRGNVESQTIDSDGDDDIDENHTRSYNRNDDIIYEEHDFHNDGKPDANSRYVYSGTGELAMVARDNDLDGRSDVNIYYLYNRNGSLVNFLIQDGAGKGMGGRRYQYDRSGTLIKQDYDDDGDGTYSITSVKEWGKSALLRESTFINSQLDSVTSYTFGLPHLPVEILTDYNQDGTADEIRRFQYSSSGILMGATEIDVDETVNQSGYEYDANGRPSKSEFTENGHLISTIRWHYDCREVSERSP